MTRNQSQKQERETPESVTYEVWYAVSLHPCLPPFFDSEHSLPTFETLTKFYAKVTQVIAKNPEEAFGIMSNPNGEWLSQDRRSLITRLFGDHGHTTMTTGDLLYDKDSGEWYRTDWIGFTKFVLGSEEAKILEANPEYTPLPSKIEAEQRLSSMKSYGGGIMSPERMEDIEDEAREEAERSALEEKASELEETYNCVETPEDDFWIGKSKQLEDQADIEAMQMRAYEYEEMGCACPCKLTPEEIRAIDEDYDRTFGEE